MTAAPRARTADALAVVGLLVLVAVLARLRWAGAAPFGSDNDEYRMLAESLWQDGNPVIAGVEGTKYPLGYSFLLGALDRLGLPLTPTALVLNALLVAALVVGVYLVSRRLGAVPALLAATVLALSTPLWAAFYSVMPDVALTAVVLAGFGWLLRRPGRRDVLVLTALAAVAMLLKSLALTLGLALGAALLLRPGQRRWAWAPPLAAAAVAGGQALLMRRYPPSVTGYGEVFWLVDPGNAAQGRIGWADLPARIWQELPQALAEPGHALVGRGVSSPLATLIVVGLLAAAAWAFPRWRLPLVVLWLSHTVLLAAWNFRGDRFGLPLVPLEAVGVAALVAGLAAVVCRVPVRIGARTATGLAAVPAVVAVAVLAADAVPALRDAARVDGERYAAFQAATDELRGWAEEHVGPDERIASVDYREISYRLDRPVLPVAYNRDPQALLADTAGAGAEWFVTLNGLYGRREGLADTLVSAYPERFALRWSNGLIDVYEIAESRS